VKVLRVGLCPEPGSENWENWGELGSENHFPGRRLFLLMEFPGNGSLTPFPLMEFPGNGSLTPFPLICLKRCFSTASTISLSAAPRS